MNRICYIALFPVVFAACKPQVREDAPADASPTQAQSAPVVPSLSYPDPAEESEAIFISPTGNDQAEGSRSAPLASLNAALARLSPEKGGLILLRGGVYRWPLNLPPVEGTVAPITIAAAKGEQVVFEGGTKITRWEPYHEKAGLFLIHAPDRKTALSQTNYFEVWENGSRVRYRKVADAKGVEAWPGSVCLLKNDRLLVHIPGGKTPAEVDLHHNQQADGGGIQRSKVLLHGLHFQNYLGGGEARAMTISKGEDIRVAHCRFINNTIGISNSAHRTIIEDSQFLEAGLGVRFAGFGTDMQMRRCLLESATGLFAFSDLGEHMRNGIRIYHSGDGATIEQCVTGGFWAGLYIKTVTHRDGSRPVVVRNNTFLDTFRSGADHRQPRTLVERNILGPFVEASGAAHNGAYLRNMGATLRQNYYFGHEGAAIDGEANGPEPFVDLSEGDLRLRAGVRFPVPEAELGATALRQVTWNPRLANALRKEETLIANPELLRPPVVTASGEGALISIHFTTPVKARLHYRKAGSNDWAIAEGLPNTVVRPASMAASTPVAPEVIREWSTLFVLLKNKLEPGQSYEFRITSGDAAATKEWFTGTFTTQGEPKVIHVSANAAPETADGTAAAPFPSIQDALDRALPGDRVEIAPGVYKSPLLLLHGGTPEKPLVIAGSGMKTTILDGGKQAGTMLEIRNAPDVHISGLQIRWFANHGLYAITSPRGKLIDSWIWNQALFPRATGISGQGALIEQSAGWEVRGSVFNRMEHGILAVRSPRIRCTHNTAFGNIYSGIALVQSARESVVTHNTLNFTGNVSYHVREDNPDAFASLISDYNNFGNHLRVAKEIDQGGTIRKVEGIRPENDFTPAERYGGVTESKFIIESWIGKKGEIFLRLGDWQRFSGKDQHSIYADPEFVAPIEGDFRILAASPNRLADGSVIGSGEAVTQ